MNSKALLTFMFIIACGKFCYSDDDELPERLTTFDAGFQEILDKGLDNETRLAPVKETVDHDHILEIIFPLLTRTCGVVNRKFVHLLWEASQLLANLAIPTNQVEPVTTGNNEDKEPQDEHEHGGDGDVHAGDYGDYAGGGSATVAGRKIRECNHVFGELLFQTDERGVPISYSHVSTKEEVHRIKTKTSLFEKKNFLSPIVESLWQTFLFSYFACSEELRRTSNAIEDFVLEFMSLFDKLFINYWMDEKEYTAFYNKIFLQLDYNTELEKIKACVSAYTHRHPDLIVARRPIAWHSKNIQEIEKQKMVPPQTDAVAVHNDYDLPRTDAVAVHNEYDLPQTDTVAVHNEYD